MKCCGVNDYKDFNQTNTDGWRKPGGNVDNPLDAPVVCCVNPPSGMLDTDFNCAREATLDINNEVRTFVLRYVCNTFFIMRLIYKIR